jgi:hypothetical protein
MSLFDLGFEKGSIYETIVTTFDSKKRPHAAPMGVTIIGAGNLILRPFIETGTLENLRAHRCGVVNVTSNPWTFYKTALKKEPWVEPSPKSWFEPAKKVMAPRLKSSDSFVEFIVSSISGNGPRGIVRCKVVHTKFTERKVSPYCRSTFAAIEGIIHMTRVKMLLVQHEPREAEKLINLVRYYRELVDRVSPKSDEAKIIHSLLKHLED